jgi:hypothetical protein
MADSPSEALRRRSKALIVVVGYPEAGWNVTARREPSGPLLVATGHTVDEACAEMLAQLDVEEPAPAKTKLKLKR